MGWMWKLVKIRTFTCEVKEENKLQYTLENNIKYCDQYHLTQF